MTTVRARFDGSVFVPEEPVQIAAGTVVELDIRTPTPETSKQTVLQGLVEALAKCPADPDWPPDGAEQIDHYLYGTPKRT